MKEVIPSVLDYLGSVESDVLCLLSLMIEGEYFEVCYFYGPIDGMIILSQELESKIEELSWEVDMEILQKKISSLVVPYEQIINMIDEYVPPTEEEILKSLEVKGASEIDDKDVKTLD